MERIKGSNKKKTTAYLKNTYPLYLMLLPMVIYLLIFAYYPMLGLQIAFKDWKIKGGIWGSPWATNDANQLDLLKHFRELFEDPQFFVKFKNTIRISLLRLVCGFPVPIILTILLNEMSSKRFAKGFQMISYLPHFISWVVISGILTSMTASQTAFQNFMVMIFKKEIPFFTNNNLFLALVIISNIWKEAGWATIIYFAAISNISPELYEAAAIDGANRFQRIIYIILPGLVPAISINLILQASNLVYGGFDQIYNMYNKTVWEKGDILETYLFRIGILDGQYDIGAALGLFNSIIALVLTLIANKIIKKIGGEPIW